MPAATPAPSPTPHRSLRWRPALSLLLALATLASGLAAIAAPATTAGADTPYTFVAQKFDGATFPPTDWTTDSGTWAKSCSPAPPAGGCFAQASVTTNQPGLKSRLTFRPSSLIPADLVDPTLSFTSRFTPDATTTGDFLRVVQASAGGGLAEPSLIGDFSSDPTGGAVTHSYPLTSLRLPLAFDWTSLGDDGASPLSTWGISNVRITGTLPAMPRTLTANAIPNTQYLPKAGTPLTVTLTGSSSPPGATLGFKIVTPPTLGQLGPVTSTSATTATVVYSVPAASCTDPEGIANFICTDTFTFKVTDAQGNESAPVQATFDVVPGGPGDQVVAITAPSSATYETLAHNASTTQGVDLSGIVSVGPSTFPDAVEVHLAAGTGTIELPNGVASGITFTNGTGPTGQQIYMKGSVRKLNQAMGIMLFFPPDGTTPATTITVSGQDQGARGSGPFSPPVSAVININGVNTFPRPVMTVPSGPFTVADTAAPLTFAPGGFSLVDGGAGPTTNDRVVVSVNAGKLLLPSVDTSGPNPLVSLTPPLDDRRLEMVGTVADLNTALSHLTFDPSGAGGQTVELRAVALNPEDGLGSVPLTTNITVILGPKPFGTTTAGTLQNVPVTVFLCASGPAGAVLSYQITTAPLHGTFVVDPSADPNTSGCTTGGNRLVVGYTYTPATDYIGGDVVKYTVTDGHTGLVSAAASIALTVAEHTKPTAYAVSGSGSQDTPFDIVLCGENPDPAPNLTFAVTSAPGKGTVTDQGPPPLNPCSNGNEGRTFRYSPLAGQVGTDSFQYTVSNGKVSDPATASVTIANRTPEAYSQSISVDEGGSVTFRLCSSTPGGNQVTFLRDTFPQHGTLEDLDISGGGLPCPMGYLGVQRIKYTPDVLFSGPDSFVYHSTYTDPDSHIAYTSAQATVTITVDPVEIPPTANNQTVTVLAPQPKAITLTASSVHNLPLTYRVVTAPTRGTLTGSAPNLTYTPTAANGTDTFTFVANDGVADSAPATVTVKVATPAVTSSICLPGSTGTPENQFPCVGTLTPVDDGSGGTIGLAHTSGLRDAQLRLQVTITNPTLAEDTVTLTGPAGTAPWAIRYATKTGDQTAAITGAGLPITLAPGASAYITVIVFAPHLFPTAAADLTTRLTVTATSGNNPATSTSIGALVMDGTSSPTLALTQLDGTGRVTFPSFFSVQPTLFAGGPVGGARIVAGLTGTGDNLLRVKATVQPGSTTGIGVRYFLGSATDVTAQVLAGTLVLTCYADAGRAPLRAELTPGAGSGTLSVQLELTSTIDGQSAIAFLSAQLASTVQPDLYTTLPQVGNDVYEATPVTQTQAVSVQSAGSTTKRVFLHNEGSATDTFTVRGAVTQAATDTSAVTFAVAPPTNSGPGTPADATAAIKAGTYAITLRGGEEAVIEVTDKAGAVSGLAPVEVVLTATSALAATRVDSFKLTFPSYFYKPDAVLTAVNGSAIGANVFDDGTKQTDTWDVDQGVTSIGIALVDRGTGASFPAPARDDVVVKAPASTADFGVTYRLTTGGKNTDVTAAITGAGLPLSLLPNGGPAETLVVDVTSAVTAKAGAVGNVKVSVTSASSLPAGANDAVKLQLYNLGSSQLRFAGLPQPEPADITKSVTDGGLQGRVAPFPSAGYGAGATYGAYPDPTGQKFAYVSGYDTVGLVIAVLKTKDTTYRLQMGVPNDNSADLPLWVRQAYALSYFNNHNLSRPGDPLGDSGVHPVITVGGQDVTAQVLAGTYTTPALHSGATLELKVTFDASTSQRFKPIRVNLINAATGRVEDAMTMGLSSLIECGSDGYGQQLAKIKTASGATKRLSFRAFDRTAGAGATECLQRLSHSWISPMPVVFSSYVEADGDTPAGGYDPNGLWLYPQGVGGVIKIDTDTLQVTSPYAKAYVDASIVDDNGVPDPSTFKILNYVGDYPNLVWNTTDATTGLKVGDNTALEPSPWPLVQPGQSSWPGNTMAAARYFQIQQATGTPLMMGQMYVNQPWFHGDVPFFMFVDNGIGLTQNYAAPPDTRVSLPGDDETTTYGFFWRTKKDGVIQQGGCLGLPPAFFNLVGIDMKVCVIYVNTTFKPVPRIPTIEAKIANIEFGLKPVYKEVGVPTFLLKALSGQIELNPDGGRVEKVVVQATFGVGPPTPCAAENRAREAAKIAATAAEKVTALACPSNYFNYDAKITFKQGGFTGQSANTGVGIRFDGSLSLLGVIQLNSVQADISTDPFNFHFANNAIDLSISAGISVTAKITLEGNVGAAGFEIGVSGSLSVMGESIASASGLLSTKGMGVCGGVAGVSMGFGTVWGDTPTVYASGCTTKQFKVNQ